MKNHSYFKGPKNKTLLLENLEEKKMIHQFNTKCQEIELENSKGKYVLNEIR